MNTVLLVEVDVNGGPLPGQGSRASSDFGVTPPANTTGLLWETVDRSGIHFNVAIDVPWGSDTTILSGLTNGSVSGYPPTDEATRKSYQGSIYVCEVKGASSPFKLRVSAVTQ